MESIHRNVILDLLPSYLAGKASEETRALIEEYAQNDPEIARLIQRGPRVRNSVRRQLVYVALATAALLLVPLVAMQFTGEVDWTGSDFIVAGLLLFGTGLMYVLISRLSDSRAYRAAVGVAVVAGLMLIWLNLAVGLIGNEDNPANQLYAAVLLIGLIGAAIARFRPRGMMRALLVTTIAQFLVPVIAMIIWRPEFTVQEVPGVVGVFILNGFFAALFAVSALLFRRASEATAH